MAPTLRLYNTLTRSKDVFVPIDPKNVRLYVCGPTVYDYAHIGNARPIIVFDLLFRLLRHLYGPDAVTYVRNITDVDDKINARAARDYPDLPHNEAIRRGDAKTEEQFHADIRALGVLMPDDVNEPGQAAALRRAAGDRAYRRDAHDHRAADRARRRLCGRGARAVQRLGDAEAAEGAAIRRLLQALPRRTAVRRPGRRGALQARPDGFRAVEAVRPAGPGLAVRPAGIATPGRPGWHIECSAMSWKHLVKAFETRLTCDDPDERETFDIHGGGIDLVFPHHENEIAQSCCAFDMPRMANVWMHNGFLQVEGEKMSKSLGNFFTIRTICLADDWPGEVLRFNMLRTHYRQPIDWTVKGLEESEKTLDRWYELAGRGTAVAARRHRSSMRWRTISTRRGCWRSSMPSTGRARTRNSARTFGRSVSCAKAAEAWKARRRAALSVDPARSMR